MRKLCSRFVPKSLMAEQKQCRLDVTTNWFEQCVADSNSLDRVITGDELWFFEYDPSDQQANKAYVKEGEPSLKTPSQSCSNTKSMLILFFFDRHGIVHHQFFKPTPEARGVNGQLYLDILKWLHAHIACIKPELFAINSWVFHYDNASPHTTHVVIDW